MDGCGKITVKSDQLCVTGIFFVGQEQPYTFSGCNKSPLVDPTHQSLSRVGRSAGLWGRLASGLFLFLDNGATRMETKRVIDPKLWRDEEFGTLSVLDRLLFIGLISIADDDGNVYGSHNSIRLTIFPYDKDISTSDIKAAMNRIGRGRLIVEYPGCWSINQWDRYFYDFDPKKITEWIRLKSRVFRRDKFKCVYCGKPAEHGDHIIAQSKGGWDADNNLVAACHHCNISKKNYDWLEWYQSQPFFNKQRVSYIRAVMQSG